jgi:hypothetical protein
MKIPRSKFLGIFIGEEIYYTGGAIPQSKDRFTTFPNVVIFPEQARTEGSTGYGLHLPITKTKRGGKI